ncbi:MAG: hypothetical protein RL033_3200 [Pseudomonadota bacterium]
MSEAQLSLVGGLSLLVGLFGLVGCEDPPAPKQVAPVPASAPVAVPVPVPATAPPPAAVAEKIEKPAEKLIDCPKPPKVALNDAALEAEVRRKASKAEGELTVADLKKVRSVDLTRGGKSVDYLDPCAFPQLTQLRHLYLAGGELSDLTPIASLTFLEGLRASANKVSSLAPLKGMRAMDRLDLGRTQVRDLTPLKGMTKLTELQLDDTPVDDIGVLASLSSLERLSIKRTRVSDLTPLKGLRKLKFLYVGGSPAADNVTAVQRAGLKISGED